MGLLLEEKWPVWQRLAKSATAPGGAPGERLDAGEEGVVMA